MKITLDDAIKAIESGCYTLVKDDKAKIAHHINKETGESMITYKAAYFLQAVTAVRSGVGGWNVVTKNNLAPIHK